ncbi:MAG: amidohydrolase family protein [Candidatus Hydrogenedentales bacterium]
MKKRNRGITGLRYATLLVFSMLAAAGAVQAAPPEHGVRPAALVIRGGIVVEGPGTPAEGPMDVFIRDGRIESVAPARTDIPESYAGAAVIDASDHYLLPGFINMHGHAHTSWGGRPADVDYIYKLWLAAGITTVRDVGSDSEILREHRGMSERGELAAPRLILYYWFPNGRLDTPATPVAEMSDDELRQAVRELKAGGADGLKLRHFDRDDAAVIMAEANAQELPVAHHIGIEDMNALDAAEFGTRTIEHWYGIPDAALTGIQAFPTDFNHNNELHRFRYAGRLWQETDPAHVDAVLHSMVESGVAWDPTFAIYEAARDLQRAVTNPAFAAYLHPNLGAFFEPNPGSHGSFFFGWTHTDEVYWKENYRIWMDAVVRFDRMGGTVVTGEDAGYIYQLYGFCYLRELQLQQEAGFHPLEVIRNATHHGARVLGREDELGRIKAGYRADVLVVNGNPLDDLHVLYPRGVNSTLDQQHGERGGIAWTIKDGIAYQPAQLLSEVRATVNTARDEQEALGGRQ